MATETPTRYWIIVASRDHVQRGVSGGFAQANHGKGSPLKRIKTGDRLIYYSPKMVFGQEEKCQCFTAIGDILAGDVYAATMDVRIVNRRNVVYLQCNEVSILPLIYHLSFIQDKRHWGAPFRFGMLEIPITDFELIAGLMSLNPHAAERASSPAGDTPST